MRTLESHRPSVLSRAPSATGGFDLFNGTGLLKAADVPILGRDLARLWHRDVALEYAFTRRTGSSKMLCAVFSSKARALASLRSDERFVANVSSSELMLDLYDGAAAAGHSVEDDDIATRGRRGFAGRGRRAIVRPSIRSPLRRDWC